MYSDRLVMSALGIEISSSNSQFVRAQFAPSLANREFTIGVSELTEEEKKMVEELRQRDAEVRRHEQAHKAAAGPYAKGSPTYEYIKGPDGKQYAVGGETQIDSSEVPNNPSATIHKAQTIRRAALAPKDPSIQDRRVATEASQMEARARHELSKQNREERQTYDPWGESVENREASVVDVFA